MNAGEFDLIKDINRIFPELDSSDDAAFIPLASNGWLILTVDQQVEDIHYRREWLTPEETGYKAVASAVSDISSCSGKPLGVLSSISIPSDLSKEYIQRVYAGMREFLAPNNIPLQGGNITGSVKGLSISTTVLGYSENPVKRNGAKAGDGIFITGEIGYPKAFLDIMLNNIQETMPQKGKFAKPPTRIAEGLLCGKSGFVHAMTDISDGLISDLVHILDASSSPSSQLKAEIELSSLPLSEHATEFFKSLCLNPFIEAAKSGEEYELIIICPKEKAPELGFDTTYIGEITDKENTFLYNGKKIDPRLLTGFSHF